MSSSLEAPVKGSVYTVNDFSNFENVLSLCVFCCQNYDREQDLS